MTFTSRNRPTGFYLDQTGTNQHIVFMGSRSPREAPAQASLPFKKTGSITMPSPTEITTSQLARLIGTPACPKIVDVSIDVDFSDDPYLIPTAIRHPFDEIETLCFDHPEQTVVVICQKGLKLSQGAAAILRTMGISAQNLEGGNHAWRDANLMRIPNDIIPWKASKRTLWVTRHRPKIDRIACPWLIRRFVDPHAQFMYVSPSQVIPVAEKFSAIPFDVENVSWSHNGDECTFDTMIKKFALNSRPLELLANIVRGTDTNQHNLAPECAGLLAVSVGLSRMYKDDLQQMEAGFLLYDALYRWARDGQNEIHNSATNTAKN
jgi:rhodanese-related sulfurtransferase